MAAAVGLDPDQALAVLNHWAAAGRLWVMALRPGVASHYVDAHERFTAGGQLTWLRRYDGADSRWDLVLSADRLTAVCFEVTRISAYGADDQPTKGAGDGLEDETPMGAAPGSLG